MGALRQKIRWAAMAPAAIASLAGVSIVQAQDAETPAAAADDKAPPPLAHMPAAETAPTETANEASTTPPLDRLPAGTVIEIRIDEPVNSKTYKTGDWYAISLSRPIMLGDAVLIPAGTSGCGQIVHAAKSSWGGKAGELILGARYLDYHGKKIALRGMKLGGVGSNNEGIAFATMVAGGLVATPLVFAINGKNADIQPGTLATAKLTADLFPESPPVSAKAAPSAIPETIESVATKQEGL